MIIYTSHDSLLFEIFFERYLWTSVSCFGKHPYMISIGEDDWVFRGLCGAYPEAKCGDVNCKNKVDDMDIADIADNEDAAKLQLREVAEREAAAEIKKFGKSNSRSVNVNIACIDPMACIPHNGPENEKGNATLLRADMKASKKLARQGRFGLHFTSVAFDPTGDGYEVSFFIPPSMEPRAQIELLSAQLCEMLHQAGKIMRGSIPKKIRDSRNLANNKKSS